jgi:hypothetical protein
MDEDVPALVPKGERRLCFQVEMLLCAEQQLAVQAMFSRFQGALALAAL